MNVYSFVTTGHSLFNGDYWQIVQHYMLEEAGDNHPYAFAQQIIIAHQAANEASFQALLGLDIQIDNYTCRRITGDGGPTAIQGRGITGSNPTNVDARISMGARIAWIPLASNKLGATIIPGIPAEAYAEGAWDEVYVDAVNEYGDAMTTPLVVGGGGGDANLIVWIREDPLDLNIVLEAALRDRPAVIGRRTLQ